MKVSKALIGRPVRLTWLDPCSYDTDEADVPRGRAALARWEEWGIVVDVHEGVVTLASGRVVSTKDTKPRYQGSVVPEELVEEVEELVVKPREGQGGA